MRLPVVKNSIFSVRAIRQDSRQPHIFHMLKKLIFCFVALQLVGDWRKSWVVLVTQASRSGDS
jgi:hypothetical protein